MSQYTIKQATTDAEKLAAYKVRYETLTKQLGDERYANHELGTYKDTMDERNCRIYIVMDQNDAVIATARLSIKSEISEFLAEEFYQLDFLCERYNCDANDIALLDKVGVLPTSKGGFVFFRLLNYALIEIAKAGAQVCIGAIEKDNETSLNTFSKYGWIVGDSFKYKENVFSLLYGKINFDKDGSKIDKSGGGIFG